MPVITLLPATLLQIGAIRRAHGLHGLVRVHLHNPQSTALRTVCRIYIGDESAAPGGLVQFEVGEVRDLGGGEYLVLLEGVGDRDAAEALRGLCVYADRADLLPPEEGEVFIADLIGCEVRLQGGEPIGSVREVLAAGGSDLLVVDRPGRTEALVPCVPEILMHVDLAARRIEIDPPEGLLDLDLPVSKGGDRDEG